MRLLNHRGRVLLLILAAFIAGIIASQAAGQDVHQENVAGACAWAR